MTHDTSHSTTDDSDLDLTSCDATGQNDSNVEFNTVPPQVQSGEPELLIT